MLVLSRKQNQEVLIGDQIKITVLKSRGNTVRLGIDAPRDIKVVRGELTAADSQDDQQDDSTEFTIVFGSESDSDPEKQEHRQHVQFKRDATASARLAVDRPTNRIANQSTSETIRFQGRLPKVLKHNRLKQIVDRIAIEKGASAVNK
jgi:carbon storage regulator CsrA